MSRSLVVGRHVEGEQLGLEQIPLIMEVQDTVPHVHIRDTFRCQARAMLSGEARLWTQGIVLTSRRYRKFGEALVAQADRFDDGPGTLARSVLRHD
jgi:hypothetical protein